MDGNATVIGCDATVVGNNSVLKDGDQLIEISTFSQTQLNQAIENACHPLLEKVIYFIIYILNTMLCFT